MTDLSRRELIVGGAATALFLRGTAAFAATGSTLKTGPAIPFSEAELVERAWRMAGEAYRERPVVAPEVIESIDYDAHGKIRYRPGAALFGDGPGAFPATFFHVGRYFTRGVRMHVVRGGEAAEILYAPELFDMPADSVARKLPADVGFAGFRFQESNKRADWRTQDWLAFLGASYFRAIGELGQYGLSARGIAVNSATPGPEEFPDFTEFFIAESASDSDTVTVFALLDGPSISGAYRFDIRRTQAVIIDVDCHLFLRRDVARLGVAPITSMYWYGENTRSLGDDWRPEIHDSDGLSLWTGGGERIWRPLSNPRHPTISSFVDDNPRGFGLMQRDRDFDHFLDGVRYERRPNLWIEPLDGWGRGAVQLMELRTDDEVHDNIGAFWVPEAPAVAGSSYRFRYRQHWVADAPFPVAPNARCVTTRTGRGGQPGQDHPANARKFVIEFEGPALLDLPRDAKVEAVVGTSSGRISDAAAERVPGMTRWRLFFDVHTTGGEACDLRAFLRYGGTALTETWIYRYDPLPRT